MTACVLFWESRLEGDILTFVHQQWSLRGCDLSIEALFVHLKLPTKCTTFHQNPIDRRVVVKQNRVTFGTRAPVRPHSSVADRWRRQVLFPGYDISCGHFVFSSPTDSWVSMVTEVVSQLQNEWCVTTAKRTALRENGCFFKCHRHGISAQDICNSFESKSSCIRDKI